MKKLVNRGYRITINKNIIVLYDYEGKNAIVTYVIESKTVLTHDAIDFDNLELFMKVINDYEK